jgi:hypothetical protein
VIEYDVGMLDLHYGHELRPDRTHICWQPDGSLTVEVTPPSQRWMLGIAGVIIGSALLVTIAIAMRTGSHGRANLPLLCCVTAAAASVAAVSIVRRDSRHAWIVADRAGLRITVRSMFAREHNFEWARPEITAIVAEIQSEDGRQALRVQTRADRTYVLYGLPDDELRALANALTKALS